ncbi:Variant surface glycoprotein [Trypanosoma congolense IL3000]|uniref:Variant surface glycoprotein n=1 Tax=Trypanosoma congolense (strain IL3000) TaxID=1068625 RepID=F9W755_TRYCI|nr:Variant surface glycoprotein [Trypanosoma congolense IL3000]
MARYMNAISLIILSFVGVVSGQEEVAVGKYDNIEPFSLLCRIYNVAKNPPINYIDLDEPFKIVEEIDALNRSLSEEEGLHEKEDAGNYSATQVKQTVTRETALAQLSLNQITRRAHKILEDIKKMNVSKEIENAKAEFNKVIFGENGNASDLEHTALNGVKGRTEACGRTGLSTKGNDAGKNLVVDFFCLCARRTDGEGVNKVCGFYLGSNSEQSQYGWDHNGPWGSSTMWASIKGGCEKHMQEHPKSTAEARHILDQFLKHLKTGGVYRQIKSDGVTRKPNVIVEGSNRMEGMLGTGITVSDGSEVTCSGEEGGKERGGSRDNLKPGGVCVYYGTSDWKSKVSWLKQFQTALTSVDFVNKQTAYTQRAIKKIQMLLQRAEEIFETTRVIKEIKYPVLHTAFQNASGNLTAHNATGTRSYNNNSHPYLIPLLVLLFL